MRKLVEKMIRHFMHCILEANGRGIFKEDFLDYDEYCEISGYSYHPDVAYEILKSKRKVCLAFILLVIAIPGVKAIIFFAKRKAKKARGI